VEQNRDVVEVPQLRCTFHLLQVTSQ
jgi:hypothetical protein